MYDTAGRVSLGIITKLVSHQSYNSFESQPNNLQLKYTLHCLEALMQSNKKFM